MEKKVKLEPFVFKKKIFISRNYYENLDKRFVKKRFSTFSKIVKNLNLVLMHKCNNISKFNGRDIDTFYINENKIKKFSIENGILRKKEFGSYRLHLNDENLNSFLTLDIENPNILAKEADQILKDNFYKANVCNKTNLKHYDNFSNCYYKLVKYFNLGFVHSYKQLFILKKDINELDQENFERLLKLINKNLYNEKYFIHKLINENFIKFEKNVKIKNFWIKKRVKRQEKRKVFNGDINFKNALKIKLFLYALIFGSYAFWPKNHLPMVGIAIVGNDGSGKSLTTEYIKNNFSKMDPTIINMKASAPYLISLGRFRLFLKKIRKQKIFNKVKILFKIISIIGLIVEFLDKYIKYRIGMAWADSGQGLTIFERYTTDRLRGEFPNKNNKWLPLEQFFPFPDGIIYMDISPKISMKRKPNDQHTLEELNNKRDNYISLLKDFNEVKTINGSDKLSKNVKLIKNNIFFLTKQKIDHVRNYGFVKRVKWKKNINRILMGDPNLREERDKFL